MRVVLLIAAVLGMAFAQPIESSLGTMPPPPIVGMTGPEVSIETGMLGNDDLAKWAVTQGGLTTVAMVLIWVLYRELRTTKDDKRTMLGALEKNTEAHTRSAEANNRLARALEQRGVF